MDFLIWRVRRWIDNCFPVDFCSLRAPPHVARRN